MDFQVKIRGFRIELGEIEEALRQHPGVRDAVVVVQGEREKRLVAYVVAGIESAGMTAELRDGLKRKLPNHMVPSVFVLLPELPLTPSGKLDRKALPLAGTGAVRESGAVYAAPVGERQQKIAAVWQEVLRIEQVGTDSNFFDLGGDSLLLMRVRSRLQQVFDRDITMVDMFRHTTVRALAHHLAGPPESSAPDRGQMSGEERKAAMRRQRHLRGRLNK